MKSPGHLVIALTYLSLGLVLLFTWKRLYKGALDSHRRVTEFLGLPLGSEQFYRLFTRFVVIVVSAGCLLAAISELEQAVTGREPRLREMQWRDLWPF